MTATVARGQLAKIHDSIEYYPHQVEGIRQMAKMSSFILGDDMGLGKSLQALTVSAIDFEMGWASRVLIVCPATLKGNWEQEVAKFTSFTSMVLDGSPAARSEQLAQFDADVLIVNYEQVRPHVDELNRLGFDIAILDEAHYIKNHKSQRTKACMKLRSKRFMLLTGSPLLNHVNDLWALLHRIDPTEYPSYWTFLHRFAVFGGFKDKQIVGVKNQDELTERLQSVMIRRRKEDVLDLPDKQHITVWVDMHPDQAKLIKQANDELQIDIPDNPTPMELENALTKMLRLKQILSTTANIAGYEDHSYKLDRAQEMVAEIIANGEPVVVWTQFRGTLAAFADRLNHAGIGVFQLHGDVPARERAGVVAEWTAEAAAGRPTVMLAMLQVAGVGLTMTAASKCIFLDKLYVPKLNEQAEDRIHRIGADLTKPVQIYEVLVRKSIEERIEAILRRKQKIFGELVETSEWKRALVESMKEDA